MAWHRLLNREVNAKPLSASDSNGWSHNASNGDAHDDDDDNVTLANDVSATGQRRRVNESGT